MTIEELLESVDKQREDLAQLCFDVGIGREKDYAQVKTEKRKLATMLTVLKERRAEKSIPSPNKEKTTKKGSKDDDKTKQKVIEKEHKLDKSKRNEKNKQKTTKK